VAAVVYAARALDDLERLLTFLAREDAAAAVPSAAAIRSAVSMLAEHPLVGRVRHGELRELVISFGKTGDVALYRFVPHRAEVRILGFRHQRELDVPLCGGSASPSGLALAASPLLKLGCPQLRGDQRSLTQRVFRSSTPGS